MMAASKDLSRVAGAEADASICHPAWQASDRPADGPERTIPMAGPAVIEVLNVSKSFGPARVLNSVSLSLVKGEVLALCGPSGSGKSTLLRCINGLERVDRGTVRVLGATIGGDQAKAGLFRSRIGMVFQRPGLYPHMSVLDNITLALRRVRKLSREAADDRAHSVLAQVGVGDKAHARPATLSGGQQQRVAIARALVLDPEVLLLDEPTSALDPERVREVLDVLRNLAPTGITMAIATHELGFARQVAHSVAFLDDGVVLEITPAATFFEKPVTARAGQFLDNLIHR